MLLNSSRARMPLHLNLIGAIFGLTCLVLLADGAQQKASSRPNFVFVITDDMDIELGAMTPMVQLKKLVGDEGATFTNAFVTTPLCCPSRSSLLTGQYVHNHGSINNSISGECSGLGWQAGPEKQTFPIKFQEGGYKTFYAGKYLNMYGRPEVGGPSHVPLGWDSWVGLVGNSKYYNYSISVNGTVEKHHDDPEKDYLNTIIKEKAIEFLDSSAADVPFFMMLSTPAPHFPYIPEPKYSDSFSDSKAPRTPNFNVANGADKNWLLRQGIQPLPDDIVEKVDDVYRHRLRTLLSVDDLIKAVYDKLESKNVLSNTYILFTSDHGYHLGQFSMPMDKRQPYEFDIRVPLLIRGPGIEAGKTVSYPSTNIDLAATFLDMADLAIPDTVDGISLKPLLLNVHKSELSAKINKRILPNQKAWKSRTFLVEHSGEGKDETPGCEELEPGFGSCFVDMGCKCQDHVNYSYGCLRALGGEEDILFCKWKDLDGFEEYYNINVDPHQLNNTVGGISALEHDSLLLLLENLKECKGSSSCTVTV